MNARALFKASAAAAAATLLLTTTLAAASVVPATPNFNLEAILRPVAGGSDNGFGLVKFRQPKDADMIVYLDVWVRDVAPNHSYSLQRATDSTVDDDCTGTNWLTLGLGLDPQSITADEKGAGRAGLYRSLAAVPLGTQLDIQFRVIDAATSAVVLESGCYQFTVSQ
jgi:hypothetical protein